MLYRSGLYYAKRADRHKRLRRIVAVIEYAAYVALAFAVALLSGRVELWRLLVLVSAVVLALAVLVTSALLHVEGVFWRGAGAGARIEFTEWRAWLRSPEAVEVLGEHNYRPDDGCACGWTGDLHVKHLLDVLADSREVVSADSAAVERTP